MSYDNWEKYTKTFVVVCCDCSLQHSVQVKVDKKKQVWFRWKRDERATAARRRPWGAVKKMLWNLFMGEE